MDNPKRAGRHLGMVVGMVDEGDAVHTLAVIDAARVSAAERQVVTVRTPVP